MLFTGGGWVRGHFVVVVARGERVLPQAEWG